MRVIVDKAYGRFSVGHVIPDMPTNQARSLIARGLVREDDGKAMKSPLDRMMRKRTTK
jgi:hypothetical protein